MITLKRKEDKKPKDWTFLKLNRQIVYNTVNLNVDEVRYLFSIYESHNSYNEFVFINKEVPLELQMPSRPKKAYVCVGDKGSAETFMVWLTRCDKTYHTDKEYWLKIYDEHFSPCYNAVND